MTFRELISDAEMTIAIKNKNLKIAEQRITELEQGVQEFLNAYDTSNSSSFDTSIEERCDREDRVITAENMLRSLVKEK